MGTGDVAREPSRDALRLLPFHHEGAARARRDAVAGAGAVEATVEVAVALVEVGSAAGGDTSTAAAVLAVVAGAPVGAVAGGDVARGAAGALAGIVGSPALAGGRIAVEPRPYQLVPLLMNREDHAGRRVAPRRRDV